LEAASDISVDSVNPLEGLGESAMMNEVRHFGPPSLIRTQQKAADEQLVYGFESA